MDVNDKTLKALAASLNFRMMRQEILNSNIANADTPEYKAKRIDFEAALSRALDVDGERGMKTTDPQHFNVGNGGFHNLEPEIYEDSDGVASEDGNTVDREQELARMADNKILYDASVQLMNKKLGLIKYAIQNDR